MAPALSAPALSAFAFLAWLCMLIIHSTHYFAVAFSTPLSVVRAPSLKAIRVENAPLRSAPLLQASSDDANEPASDDVTKELLEKARKLRKEVSVIETSKLEAQQNARKEIEAMEREKITVRMRYSVEVPILKDMGQEVMERVDFPPRLKGGKSRVIALQSPLPLGLVLGEDSQLPGLTTVDEVASGSNGEMAGVKTGDVLRAVTACQASMETPTWQLLAGGIGQPKTKRFMYSANGRPLEEVMNAISSNRMDPEQRPVWLVMERASE